MATIVNEQLDAAIKQKAAADAHLKNAETDLQKAKLEVSAADHKVAELTDLKNQQDHLEQKARDTMDE